MGSAMRPTSTGKRSTAALGDATPTISVTEPMGTKSFLTHLYRLHSAAERQSDHPSAVIINSARAWRDTQNARYALALGLKGPRYPFDYPGSCKLGSLHKSSTIVR